MRKELTVQEAKAIYRDVLALPLNFQRPDRLAAKASSLAVDHRHSAYDAVYYALAMEVDCEFITADSILAIKLGHALPFIRHISTLHV